MSRVSRPEDNSESAPQPVAFAPSVSQVSAQTPAIPQLAALAAPPHPLRLPPIKKSPRWSTTAAANSPHIPSPTQQLTSTRSSFGEAGDGTQSPGSYRDNLSPSASGEAGTQNFSRFPFFRDSSKLASADNIRKNLLVAASSRGSKDETGAGNAIATTSVSVAADAANANTTAATNNNSVARQSTAARSRRTTPVLSARAAPQADLAAITLDGFTTSVVAARDLQAAAADSTAGIPVASPAMPPKLALTFSRTLAATGAQSIPYADLKQAAPVPAMANPATAAAAVVSPEFMGGLGAPSQSPTLPYRDLNGTLMAVKPKSAIATRGTATHAKQGSIDREDSTTSEPEADVVAIPASGEQIVPIGHGAVAEAAETTANSAPQPASPSAVSRTGLGVFSMARKGDAPGIHSWMGFAPTRGLGPNQAAAHGAGLAGGAAPLQPQLQGTNHGQAQSQAPVQGQGLVPGQIQAAIQPQIPAQGQTPASENNDDCCSCSSIRSWLGC